MMVALDGTIVAVANPAIQEHLNASLAGIELREDEADLTMSPIVVGLTLTCWMARQRCDISAKPRSPW